MINVKTSLGSRSAGTRKLSICHSLSPSVRPSFRPSVRPRSLVRSIASLPLAQFGPYFTHRVPLGKECAMIFNHVSRSKVKVKAELYVKTLSGAYLLSTWPNLAYTAPTECLWIRNEQRLRTMFLRIWLWS